MTAPLLSAKGLVKHYPLRHTRSRERGTVRAVDGVSFDIGRGETLGLVGESGSGKTTVARLLLRFEEPTAGTIAFEGEDWLALTGAALRRRRRDLQIVFQEPLTSLNPRMRAGDQIAEPLAIQGMTSRRERPARVAELLSEVGLPAAAAGKPMLDPGKNHSGQDNVERCKEPDRHQRPGSQA